ncbi:MAG TPA: hypothetical protein VFT22_16470, partial [Kofleriaceae bacterium]|nr:hypothetical protein [Kofleriaceae bacterium]
MIAQLERREWPLSAFVETPNHANTAIAMNRKYRNPPVSTLEIAMIRSMLLVCAVGFAGCVATSDAATDPTETVAQSSSSGGFACFNKLDIQVVSC